MRHLLPGGVEEPLDELYADLTFPAPGDDRPYVFLGMVSSLDGAATIDGESAGLGGRGDLQAFRRLRAAADAVLVGAGTVRTEDYRGVALPDEVRRARADLGREEVPPIVVVTRSVDLDPGSALFHDTRRRPWLLVPGDTDERRLLPFREIAEVVRAGTDDVDLGQGLRRLRRLGVQRLLCEGGPRLSGQLVSQGLADELFLTIAPVLVGADGPRLVEGADVARRLEVLALHEHGGDLLLRLRVGPSLQR